MPVTRLHRKRRPDFAVTGPWPWVVASLFVLWSAVAFNLWHDRKVTTADVIGDTANLTRAFAENIGRTIEAIDQSLLFLRAAYGRDPDSLESLKDLFSGRILDSLQIQVAVADRTGKLVWSSLGGSAHHRINIADREHFRAQAHASTDDLYISAPVIGRLSERQTIQFVRQILTPSGQFDGVVVVSVDPASLSRFYESISIGQGSLAVVRSDGTILAAAPQTASKVGQHMKPDVAELLSSGPASGSYRRVSMFDNVERIYSYRRLSEYPLAVIVGESVQDTFADYHRAVVLYLLGGGVLSLVSIGAGCFMHHQRWSLVRSRQALSATLENMSQGIIMVGADGTIATINRQALHLLGLPSDAGSGLAGKPDALSWVRAHLADHETPRPETCRPETFETDHTVEREGPGATVLEVRTRRLGNQSAIITISDITGRKKNETALAEAQTRAAHAERMQALGQLAGGIAHDFNNILQVVQGGAALIEKRSELASGAGRLARMIVDATERGTSITRRLLAFARRGELRAEPVSPAPLMEGLREVLQHTLGSPIAVTLRAQDSLPLVSADKGQLETALVNLATNARDAMPEGGNLTLSATLETVSGRAHPADLASGRYVRFSIEDTGIGMDRATLHRVVEPFFTTKPVGQGTGLGLPMAKGFAEQSGGGLAIDSEPGRGTRVHVWLPALANALPDHDVPPLSRRMNTGSARHLLLVDDELLVLETLTMALQDAGYVVTAASDAAQALELEESGIRCDALVTDLSMPRMGGLQLIQEMQARRPGLHAILLTGYAGQGAHLAVSDALLGSYILMRKPVTAAQIADRVEALLERPRDEDLARVERARLTEV